MTNLNFVHATQATREALAQSFPIQFAPDAKNEPTAIRKIIGSVFMILPLKKDNGGILIGTISGIVVYNLGLVITPGPLSFEGNEVESIGVASHYEGVSIIRFKDGKLPDVECQIVIL